MPTPFTLEARYEALRAAKMAHTAEKWQIIGAMNHDDWGLILPPPDRREVVQALSGSGVLINDVRLTEIPIAPNHPSGGFFGPVAVGRAFRALLERHPVHLDPAASLAGAIMANFMSYRKPHWNPDLDFSYLHADQHKYQIGSGIGATQHFCPDLAIGLELGWGGLLKKIAYYREANAPRGEAFYAGLTDVILGMQDWIGRHAAAAQQMAADEPQPEVRRNLAEIAEMNAWLVNEPPRTFREACQWMLWYLIAARMYNGSGATGRLDVLLQPYYERDTAAGVLTDDEAAFHIACLLLRETGYIQLGGPDAAGQDTTNPVSYLVLEAAHRMKIPANVGVCVGRDTDPGLLTPRGRDHVRGSAGHAQIPRRGSHGRGICPQRLSPGAFPPARLLRLSLAGAPRRRIYHERPGEDQPGGRLPGRAGRDAGSRDRAEHG